MGAEELRGKVGAAERGRALDLAARLGGNPFAFCLRYDAPWRFLFGAGVDGAVAYLERDRVALVWADPIAAPEDADALLDEATAELRGRGLRTCLILVGEETATHALGQRLRRAEDRRAAVLLAGGLAAAARRSRQAPALVPEPGRPREDRRPPVRAARRARRRRRAALVGARARPAGRAVVPARVAAHARRGEAAVRRGARRPDRGHRRVHALGGEPLVPRGSRPAAGRSDGNDGGARGRRRSTGSPPTAPSSPGWTSPRCADRPASSTAARSCSSAPRSRRSRCSTPATASAR